MDKNGRARIPFAGNEIIKPKMASNRNVSQERSARHVVCVNINDKTSSIGYRYNDTLEMGITVDTNTLIGFFK